MDRRTKLEPKRTTVSTAQSGVYPHTIPAGQTNYVVCDGFTIEKGRQIRVDILLNTAATSAGNELTFKLQTSPGQDTAKNLVWVDVKSFTALASTITAPGSYVTLRMLDTVAADQPFLPLAGQCRIVATTAGTGTAVVGGVYVLSM